LHIVRENVSEMCICKGYKPENIKCIRGTWRGAEAAV